MLLTDTKVLLSRQAIFDRHKQVVGYELLFRTGAAENHDDVSANDASTTLISDAVQALGLDTLTRGIPTFIKISREWLIGGLPPGLPPQQIVLELGPEIQADDEVCVAVAALLSQGYRIALDGYRPSESNAGLVPYASFLKSDVAGMRGVVAASVGRRAKTGAPILMATHVESMSEFDAAAALGCLAFQGGFIGRPVMRVTADIPANRAAYLRLLRELQNPDITTSQLEELIKPDASLVFRTLRAVNSAAHAQHSHVDSVRQALMLLGCDTVRQWVSAWALTALGADVPDELVATSTLRGRVCEIIARADTSGTLGDGFLLGMCSLLDAILEVPMEQILRHLPLPAETEAALRGDDNPSRRLLDCITAYERGDWNFYMMLEAKAGLAPNAVPNAYAQALLWYAEIQPGNPVPRLLAQEPLWRA